MVTALMEKSHFNRNGKLFGRTSDLMMPTRCLVFAVLLQVFARLLKMCKLICNSILRGVVKTCIITAKLKNILL